MSLHIYQTQSPFTYVIIPGGMSRRPPPSKLTQATLINLLRIESDLAFESIEVIMEFKVLQESFQKIYI